MDIISSLLNILSIIGFWFIFKKFGIKRWHALIPFLRDYRLAQCANEPKDGLIYTILSGIIWILSISYSIVDEKTVLFGTIELKDALALLMLILVIPEFVFSFRICKGLCERFGKKYRWIIGWFLFEGITSLIWGLSSKYVPLEKEKEDTIKETVEESGVNTTGSDKDLTINIRERSAKTLRSKRTLLKDIHMNIQPGHMVLLLGGSGAGKTTFLNAVTGYEMADADIELGNDNVYKDYINIKYDIGFVPQQDLMRGSDTVYNTLYDAAKLRLPKSLSREDRKKRVDEVLDSFGLGMLKNTLVDKLSGGQKKRLSISMEFISNPRLFILDEPDSGLDGVVARELFEKLRDIADSGKIVIVITHTPDRVIDLFDDVIVLAKDANRSGRLTYFGPIKESYEFFGKESMEGFLLAINQKEEGGEGRAEELVKKYNDKMKLAVGGEV